MSVPVDVGPGGNLERELAYRSHRSTDRHANKVCEKAVGEVKSGRAIVVAATLMRMVQSLRDNPVRVVDEKGERTIIHDATLSSEPTGGKGEGRPVNKTTYWDHIPKIHLEDLMLQILRSIV